MTQQTLTTPDVPLGAQIQMQVADGDGTRLIQVFGGPGSSGSGTVTSVTGTAPIVVTGTPTVNPNITLDLTGLHFWPFDAAISDAVVAPELAQNPRTTAALPEDITIRSQAAQAGSGQPGGNLIYVNGKPDAGGAFNAWYIEGTPGGGRSSPGTFGMMSLHAVPGSGVPILNLGLGTDGNGAGVAGTEIAAFALLSHATELGAGSNSPIRIQPASSFGGQSFFDFEQDAASGNPICQMSSVAEAGVAATTGVIRMAWETSGTRFPILVQRDAGNTVDFEIVSIVLGELYYNTFIRDCRFHMNATVLYECFTQNGQGWQYQGPFGITWTTSADSLKTIRQGGGTERDGKLKHMQGIDVPGTQTVSTLTLNLATAGTGPTAPTYSTAVQTLTVTVLSQDNNGDFSSWTLTSTFRLAGGVVTASSAPGVPVDNGHSVGGVQSSPLAFTITGTSVNVRIGTYATSTTTHIVTSVERVVNAGTF